jgi:hypothetical protein
MLKLKAGEDNPFDTATTGARLRPVCFGSQKCDPNERHYHSSVDEAAAGRWAIGKCKRFIYGGHFFWLCDCDAVKDVVHYHGPLPHIKRWAQELLGYNVTVLHRSKCFMRDVDALNCRYGDELLTEYMVKSAALHNASIREHPESYVLSSLQYLTLRLAAAPPPTMDYNASERTSATTSFMTASAPLILPVSSTTAAFSPPAKSEISLNQLVQISLEEKVIPWVP